MTLAYNLSQLANNVNSSGQLDAATGLTNTSSLGFPSGTLMLFQQSTAPTGWTKQTTHNNKALRVVSGTASSGGTSSFTTVFANQTPTITTSALTAAATTLSTAQLASHGHTFAYRDTSGGWPSGGYLTADAYMYNVDRSNNSVANSVQAAGSGSSHTHSITGTATSSAITLDVQYVDLIIASKN